MKRGVPPTAVNARIFRLDESWAAIHALDPQLPVFQVQTMRQGLDTMNGLLLFQIGASLAAIMGGLGLTLAVIGLYGVVSYAVGRRIHEIGLRIALGAQRANIYRLVLREGLIPVLIGAAAGVVLSFAFARVVGSLLFEVSPHNPGIVIAAICVLAAVGAAACLLPARRAAAVDPMQALRAE